jgi:hypothetical protein
MSDHGMAANETPEPRTVVVLWVIWHRVRGHWVQPSGWRVRYHRSRQIWRCITCQDERAGWAPRWLAWKEQG